MSEAQVRWPPRPARPRWRRPLRLQMMSRPTSPTSRSDTQERGERSRPRLVGLDHETAVRLVRLPQIRRGPPGSPGPVRSGTRRLGGRHSTPSPPPRALVLAPQSGTAPLAPSVTPELGNLLMLRCERSSTTSKNYAPSTLRRPSNALLVTNPFSCATRSAKLASGRSAGSSSRAKNETRRISLRSFLIGVNPASGCTQ
jgi:hypothetical protein